MSDKKETESASIAGVLCNQSRMPRRAGSFHSVDFMSVDIDSMKSKAPSFRASLKSFERCLASRNVGLARASVKELEQDYTFLKPNV